MIFKTTNEIMILKSILHTFTHVKVVRISEAILFSGGPEQRPKWVQKLPRVEEMKLKSKRMKHCEHRTCIPHLHTQARWDKKTDHVFFCISHTDTPYLVSPNTNTSFILGKTLNERIWYSCKHNRLERYFDTSSKTWLWFLVNVFWKKPETARSSFKKKVF